MKKIFVSFILLISTNVYSAPSRVQFAVSNTSLNQDVSAVFSSSVTSGNIILAIARYAAVTSTTIVDTKGNTYTQRAYDCSSNPCMGAWDTTLASSGALTVSTSSVGISSFNWIYVAEITGSAGFDVANTNVNAGGSTTMLSASITTTTSSDYVTMGVSQNNLTTYAVANDSAGNVWTLVDGQFGDSGSSFWYGGVTEFVASGTLSSDIAKQTSTITNQYTSVFVAYKGTGGGGTTGQMPCNLRLLGIGCNE